MDPCDLQDPFALAGSRRPVWVTRMQALEAEGRAVHLGAVSYDDILLSADELLARVAGRRDTVETLVIGDDPRVAFIQPMTDPVVMDSATELMPLLRSCPRLTRLDVHSRDQCNELRGLCDLTSLTSLTLNIARSPVVEELLQMPSLTFLDVSLRSGLGSLAQALPRLRGLGARRTVVSPETLGLIGAHEGGLEWLELKSSIGFAPEDLAALAPLSPGLRYLGLGACKVGRGGLAGVEALGALAPSLVALNLRGNQLTCEHAAKLAEGLPQLQHLDIAYNKIRDEGMGALARGLCQLRSLVAIVNEYTVEGSAEALCEAVWRRPCLDLAVNSVELHARVSRAREQGARRERQRWTLLASSRRAPRPGPGELGRLGPLGEFLRDVPEHLLRRVVLSI